MNDFLPAQPGDEDDDDSDDEVQIGVQRQDFVDPITLRPIEDAVVVYVAPSSVCSPSRKSRRGYGWVFYITDTFRPECGHHYSRASIMGMIEQQKGKRKTTAGIHIKCPRPSCHVKVSEHDIKVCILRLRHALTLYSSPVHPSCAIHRPLYSKS
jgi:hypothetical protein